MIAKTCVDGLFFEAMHYTPVDGVPTLHGHTFKLIVCVEGEVSGKGWVIDFNRLRSIARDALSPYNYSLIMPLRDKGYISIKGGFKVRFFYINAPEATAEAIASEICRKILKEVRELGQNISATEIELWEGENNFVRVRCG